jgi:hypothetical protein
MLTFTSSKKLAEATANQELSLGEGRSTCEGIATMAHRRSSAKSLSAIHLLSHEMRFQRAILGRKRCALVNVVELTLSLFRLL